VRVLAAGSAILLLAVVLVAILASERALQAVGNFLAVEDPLERADAVIAISGDGQERVGEAIALLWQGDAHWLILSGAPGEGSGSARELARYAARFGMDRERILMDDWGVSTAENARGSAQVMHAQGLRSAILVTSPYHMRRAAVIFRAFFRPVGLTVRAYPVQDSFFKPEGWWRRRSDRQLVIREYAKLAAFLVGIR